MTQAERGYKPNPKPPEKKDYTLEEIEDLLELNDANENLIERTAKREELLELLDQFDESANKKEAS